MDERKLIEASKRLANVETMISDLQDDVFLLRRMLNRIHERAVDGQEVTGDVEKDEYFKAIAGEVASWLARHPLPATPPAATNEA